MQLIKMIQLVSWSVVLEGYYVRVRRYQAAILVKPRFIVTNSFEYYVNRAHLNAKKSLLRRLYLDKLPVLIKG